MYIILAWDKLGGPHELARLAKWFGVGSVLQQDTDKANQTSQPVELTTDVYQVKLLHP